MASHIFKQELGLYLLFSEQTIKDCAFELDFTEQHLRTFIWMYYYNKFVCKHTFIDVAKTIAFFRVIKKDLPVSRITLAAINDKMCEKGYIQRVGQKYMLNNETSRAFANKLTRVFQQHLIDFETYSKDQKVKYRKPKSGRRKRVGKCKMVKHEQKETTPLS